MRLLFALVLNLCRLLWLPVRVLGWHWFVPIGSWVRVDVRGPVVEVAPRSGLGGPAAFSLQRLRALVERVGADRRVTGLLVVVDEWQGGTATAWALRRVLERARTLGKRVCVFLPNGAGTRTALVATAAHRILVAPRTQLAPLGYAVEIHYLKDALDWVGVEPEVIAHGRFKAAFETLVSAEMSQEQRQQLEQLLDNSYEILVTSLATGRGVSRTLAEQWVHEGPWAADTALRQGLIDGIVHEDDIDESLSGAETPAMKTRILRLRTYERWRGGSWAPWRRRRRIGVLELRGPIVGHAPIPGLPVATGDSFVKLADRARRDPSVRGVVLAITSPGGSVLVSERMRHAVERLARDKPVVAYLGDIAASGGYLAAVGAHAIYATPATVTGSIGVVAARFCFGELLARLGVSVHTVKRGGRADLHSSSRPLAADEREHLREEIAEVYRYFVEAVAMGRKRAIAAIEQVAEGRVYSGHRASELGLVDGTDGFEAALEDVRRRVGARRVLAAELLESGRVIDRILGGGRTRPRLYSALQELWMMALCSSHQPTAWLWCPVRVVERGG